MNMGVNNSTLGILIGLLKRKASSIQESVSSEVTEWLDENISNPDSPPLDRTLTSASSAAPADLMGDSLDLKADKTDTILYTSLSRGRKENTDIGTNSFAFGNDVTASGSYSHAEGSYTKATGNNSHAEGNGPTASGNCAHAEGTGTFATGAYSHAEGSSTDAAGSNSHAEGNRTYAGNICAHAEGDSTNATGSYSHAEGYNTTAAGRNSHAQGNGTTANGSHSHVFGSFNVADSYDNWPEWIANTSYNVGDRVKRTNGSSVSGYICKTANSDASFTSSKWKNQSGAMNYIEVAGNGDSASTCSNARALDWNGNEYLQGDLYIGCNPDSTGGTSVRDVLADIQNELAELRALIENA